MHFGRDKGKMRRCHTRASADHFIEIRRDELVIANFYYQEKYWIAKINKKEVDSVNFQWIRFDPFFPKSDFAHAQFHFVMNKRHPVELRSQITGESGNRDGAYGFIISEQSVQPAASVGK